MTPAYVLVVGFCCLLSFTIVAVAWTADYWWRAKKNPAMGKVFVAMLLVPFEMLAFGAVIRYADAAPTGSRTVRELGRHCLSPWGFHWQFTDALKRTLERPDSFQHIETVVGEVGPDGLFPLYMKYRAKNGLGVFAIGAISGQYDESCAVREFVVE